MTLAKLTDNLFPSMPSLFNDVFGKDLMDWNNWNSAEGNTTLPAVNINETDNEYNIEMAAPGLKKENFKINYDNGRLMISSEKKDHKEEKDQAKITRREFCYQSFKRSFTIPEEEVKIDKISAKYENGILKICLPKREEAKPQPAKEIEIL